MSLCLRQRQVSPQAHARKVHVAMDSDPNTAAAARVLRWIVRREVKTCTRRDIYHSNRTTFETPEEADPVVKLLEQLGYLRPLGADVNPLGGRPSHRYEINPLVHGRNPQNTQNLS